MLTVSNICKNAYKSTFILIQSRTKSKTHWAKLKKKDGPKYKALSHFDDFYGSVFGDQWEPMREALLRRNKYVAVVNNYGDTEETVEFLQNRGAHCLKKLISVQSEFHKQYSPIEPKVTTETEPVNRLADYAEKMHSDEIAQLYPKSENMPEKLDFTEGGEDFKKPLKIKDVQISTDTLEKSLSEAIIDESRIIDPSMGVTSEALYQFIPATKLKGMDEWVSESVHYSYYSKETDFPLVIEPETELSYPEHLKVYTYEMGSESTEFPEPRRGATGVLNYYPMDGGSVLAVLALGLRPGDRVLDLCSAPGGKALVALQTLLPDVIVCNDVSISRSNRIHMIFKNYFFDFETSNKWRERVILKRLAAQEFSDDEGFDKVLVDVPCTNDRHSVMKEGNNIFRGDRIRERLKIPELQTQILANALKLVKPGGTVVYSTCSLSPIQNDGVVHAGLKQAFESHNVVAAIKDTTAWMSGLSSTLVLGAGSAAPKYGQLVLPSVEANFGPSYIAKLMRVK